MYTHDGMYFDPPPAKKMRTGDYFYHKNDDKVNYSLCNLKPCFGSGFRGCTFAHSVYELNLTAEFNRILERKNAALSDQVEALCKNDINWIRNVHDDDIDLAANFEPRKKSNEDSFTEPMHRPTAEQIRLFSSKHKCEIDNPDALNSARKSANLYELIPCQRSDNPKHLRFTNRAGAKLEEILHKLDSPNLSRNPLYYADICGGPGAFPDCLDKRYGKRCRGFGITLNTPGIAHDFKYRNLPAAFTPHYGAGDGDITKEDNIKKFTEFVMKETDNEGVHLAVSDGGGGRGSHNKKGQLANQNEREYNNTVRLIAGQFALGLSVLRTGGDFVCKIFSSKDRRSLELLYLLHKSFEFFSVFKPLSSRPFNEERYVVCRNRKPNIKPQLALFLRCLGANSNNDNLIPVSKMTQDAKFWLYMRNSNDSLGRRQLQNLREVTLFAINYVDEGVEMIKQRELQAEVRNWAVDTFERNSGPVFNEEEFSDVFNALNEDFRPDKSSFFEYDPNYESKVKSDEGGKTFVLPLEKGKNAEKPTFYLKDAEKSPVYKLHDNSQWKEIFHLELPPGTLIYAQEKLKDDDESLVFSLIECFIISHEDVRGKNRPDRDNDRKSLAVKLRKEYRMNDVRIAEWKTLSGLNGDYLKLLPALWIQVYPDKNSRQLNEADFNETFLARKLIGVLPSGC